MLATGLPASPGAAVGQVVFTAEDAEEWHAQGKSVILVFFFIIKQSFFLFLCSYVRVSSVNKFHVRDRHASVEQYINETTYIINALKFCVNTWYPIHLCGYS